MRRRGRIIDLQQLGLWRGLFEKKELVENATGEKKCVWMDCSTIDEVGKDVKGLDWLRSYGVRTWGPLVHEANTQGRTVHMGEVEGSGKEVDYTALVCNVVGFMFCFFDTFICHEYDLIPAGFGYEGGRFVGYLHTYVVQSKSLPGFLS